MIAPAGWEPFRFHPEQARFWASKARFQIAPAGRRSGKSVIARRKFVRAALAQRLPDGRYVASAPTRPHAKDLHWEPLKRLVPRKFISRISESELSIWLKSGVRMQVMGMERPQRIEGSPLDGYLGDEFADMRPHVWTHHVRAALATEGRLGWAIFIGVPEGRNHYYDLYRIAREGAPGWAAFHWKSKDILPASEIAAAKRELDPLVYEQEFEASFIVFTGRAYYSYDPDIHGVEHLAYNPKAPLNLCFDFNVDPGTCSIVQEIEYAGHNQYVEKTITAVLGEIHIPRNSNTEAVCKRVIKDWGDHPGDVRIYGDATGGSRGSAKVQGSDWDLVRKWLKAHYKDRWSYRVKSHNPSERARINAMNSRFRDATGKIHMLSDPKTAKHCCRDFEGVTLLAGGSGEIDKQKHKDDGLTHHSDGVGYYIEQRFPTREAGTFAVERIA